VEKCIALHNFFVFSRFVNGHSTAFGSEFRICTLRHKNLHDVQSPILGRVAESRVAFVVNLVWICTTVQQRIDNIDVAPVDSGN
jgi:hypothetical protein